mgnify:CR=1 FL=1
MTLEEKQAQLVGFWVDQGVEVVAPMSGEKKSSTRYEDASTHGIGHLTRVYGTRPVDPVERPPGCGPSSGDCSSRRDWAFRRSCTRNA